MVARPAGFLLLSVLAAPAVSGQAAPFPVEETTIAAIHAAMTAGTLTCRALVERYLARIAAYDKQGPAINSLVALNPQALATADSLDLRARAEGRLTGPLHCIPMIVKDNFETADLPVSAGSLSLAGYVSTRDAFLVKQVRVHVECHRCGRGRAEGRSGLQHRPGLQPGLRKLGADHPRG